MDRSLWEFALALYAAPGVASRCLELQDDYGADVNLLLCAAWVGASGRGRLDAERLVALDAAVRPLRDNVVRPLRAARTWLRTPAESDGQLAALRIEIKRLELSAEQAVCARLENVVASILRVPGSTQCRAAAISNIQAYLAQLGTPVMTTSDPLVTALAAVISTENPA